MTSRLIMFPLLCLALWPTGAFCAELRKVDPQEAAKHLVTKTDPVYPEMGKQLHLQGNVVLQIAISETGTVKILGVTSGSPLLAPSAIEAVKDWKYSPFVVEGKPVAVQSLATVSFSLGHAEEEIKRQAEVNDSYFDTIRLCRKQTTDRQLPEAEETCKRAIAISAQLDATRQLERLHAMQLTGDSLFLQRKFSDALRYYQEGLIIAEKALKETDAELGDARHQVGNGLWGTGRRDEAALIYAKAENTYKLAAAHIDSAFLKNEYARKLKLVLSDHAALLRQMGRSAEADALDKEASAIIIQQGLRVE